MQSSSISMFEVPSATTDHARKTRRVSFSHAVRRSISQRQLTVTTVSFQRTVRRLISGLCILLIFIVGILYIRQACDAERPLASTENAKSVDSSNSTVNLAGANQAVSPLLSLHHSLMESSNNNKNNDNRYSPTTNLSEIGNIHEDTNTNVASHMAVQEKPLPLPQPLVDQPEAYIFAAHVQQKFLPGELALKFRVDLDKFETVIDELRAETQKAVKQYPRLPTPDVKPASEPSRLPLLVEEGILSTRNDLWCWYLDELDVFNPKSEEVCNDSNYSLSLFYFISFFVI